MAPLPATLAETLSEAADPKRAHGATRFFQTKPGQYGSGDQFIGIPMPQLRKIATRYRALARPQWETLITSPIHEQRMLALLILLDHYRTGQNPQGVVDFYIKHIDQVNSWDLVDLSAPKILGHFLHRRSPKLLYTYAGAPHLWRRRIAIVATLYFIQQGHFHTTLALAERLLGDPQALIHKAVGWMLREIGKRALPPLVHFLDMHSPTMPRTMLRYALEKFPPPQRQYYMQQRKESHLAELRGCVR